VADDKIKQDEIEALLQQAQAAMGGSPAPSPPLAAAASPQPSAAASMPGAAQSAAPKGLEGVALAESEIEALLSDTPPSPPPPVEVPRLAPDPVRSESFTQGDVELLLQQAEAAIASIDAPSQLPPGVLPFEFNDFAGTPASSEVTTLELVRDVQLDLKIELGRTHMHLEDVLRLRRGAVVTLDKLAGDPVDIFVNSRKIARGEVLVLNDNFCVRVTELVVGDSACA
jgi:flagellar motor switch protein FliN